MSFQLLSSSSSIVVVMHPHCQLSSSSCTVLIVTAIVYACTRLHIRVDHYPFIVSLTSPNLTPGAAPLEPVILFDRPKPGFCPSTAHWSHVVRVSVRCCHHLGVDFNVLHQSTGHDLVTLRNLQSIRSGAVCFKQASYTVAEQRQWRRKQATTES